MTLEVLKYRQSLYENYLKEIITHYVTKTFLDYNHAWTFHEIKSDVYQEGFSSAFDIKVPYVFRNDLYQGTLTYISDIENKKIRFPTVIYEDGLVATKDFDTARVLEFFAFMPKSTTTNYLDVFDDLLLTLSSGFTLSTGTLVEGDEKSSSFFAGDSADCPLVAQIYNQEDAFKSNSCMRISFYLSNISEMYFENLENGLEEEQ